MVQSPPLTPLGAPWTMRVASRVLPLREDEPCGDAAASFPQAGLLAIVDGLGHGVEAARAAHAAIGMLGEQAARPLPELFSRLDTRLAPTRGAAIGLMRIQADRLLYAGIGNTRAMRWRGGQMSRLPSQPGIVGGGLPTDILEVELDLQGDDWLLLFTDGLDEMLRLPVQMPEWKRDPLTLCDHLLSRYRNCPDDAGVLVAHVGAP